MTPVDQVRGAQGQAHIPQQDERHRRGQGCAAAAVSGATCRRSRAERVTALRGSEDVAGKPSGRPPWGDVGRREPGHIGIGRDGFTHSRTKAARRDDPGTKARDSDGGRAERDQRPPTHPAPCRCRFAQP